MSNQHFTIEESDRQAIVLALAMLSLQRPGWDWMLGGIAEKLGGFIEGRELYNEFKRMNEDRRPTVVQTGPLHMVVCVPQEYTDNQVEIYANYISPCGTTEGWKIRRSKGAMVNLDKVQSDYFERVECGEKPRFVHVLLEA
jgi:hypothetical protein